MSNESNSPVDLATLQPVESYKDVEKVKIIQHFMTRLGRRDLTSDELTGFYRFSDSNFPWSLVSVAGCLSEEFMRANIDRINWDLVMLNVSAEITEEFRIELQMRGYI